MFKFRASKPDGRTLIGLGLSDENVRLLTSDRPILVTLAALEIPPGTDPNTIDVVIFHGKTEEEMRDTLVSTMTAAGYS